MVGRRDKNQAEIVIFVEKMLSVMCSGTMDNSAKCHDLKHMGLRHRSRCSDVLIHVAV